VATSKDQTTKTATATTKDQPAAKKAEAKAEEAPYADQAAVLADDTRALAESIREDLDKLSERVRDMSATPTTVADSQTADGIRRIPMALDAVTQALQGLALTAADLTRQATS
jgi:hypothetical protein